MLGSPGSKSTRFCVSVRIHHSSLASQHLAAWWTASPVLSCMKIIKSCRGGGCPRHAKTGGPLTRLSFVFRNPQILICREKRFTVDSFPMLFFVFPLKKWLTQVFPCPYWIANRMIFYETLFDIIVHAKSYSQLSLLLNTKKELWNMHKSMCLLFCCSEVTEIALLFVLSKMRNHLALVDLSWPRISMVQSSSKDISFQCFKINIPWLLWTGKDWWGFIW